MPQKKWFKISRILAALAAAVVLSAATWGSTFKVLYTFAGGTDGASPNSLVFDKLGNLYGTTGAGGETGNGTAFKLEPLPDGRWKHTVLYSFSGPDGAVPVAGLVVDEAGSLYGTTIAGGHSCMFSGFGCGVVFKLKQRPGGTWVERVLYKFRGYPSDGGLPRDRLILDGSGNLYGTTSFIGPGGPGNVFQLQRNPDNTWTENILYTFGAENGYQPHAALVFDAAGNLYGTTAEGGKMDCTMYGCGVAFELTPNPDGSWSENLLHIFCSRPGCPEGMYPIAALVFDKEGNLYGTTAVGPRDPVGYGTVFRLKRRADGQWWLKVLHTFQGPEGAGPGGDLVVDAAGNLYGTVVYGGSAWGGAVFKLSPLPGGQWGYSVLHDFSGRPGIYPDAGVILDAAGNLYGTTSDCGAEAGCKGMVFEIVQ
jgi:uncharacterized repeat protein (TIGR03803 family)